MANLANLSVTTGLSQVRFEKHLTDACVGSLWLGRYLNGHDAGRTVLLRRVSRQWLSAADSQWVRESASGYSRVRHPSLTKLLNVVENGEELIGVSEHLEGVRLLDLMRTVFSDGVPVPATVALRLVLDMARATWAAHRIAAEVGLPQSLRLFVPEGVLVTSYGSTLLTEIGFLSALARCMVPRTIPTLLAQLSPEELGAKAAHAGSPEVFSLGVLLWELLANRWLFSHDSDSRTHQDLLLCEIRSLRDAERFGLELPDELVDLVTRATERDPCRRFGSVQELIQAIEGLPAEAVATEHQVSEVLRRRSPLLLAQSKSEEAERTISGTFADVGTASATHASPGTDYDWDRPTFAQRSLVNAQFEPAAEPLASTAAPARDSTPPFAAVPIPSIQPKRRFGPWYAAALLFVCVGVCTWFFRDASLVQRLLPSPAPAGAMGLTVTKPVTLPAGIASKRPTVSATKGVSVDEAMRATPLVMPTETIKVAGPRSSGSGSVAPDPVRSLPTKQLVDGPRPPGRKAVAGRTAATPTATAAPSQHAARPSSADNTGMDLQWGI